MSVKPRSCNVNNSPYCSNTKTSTSFGVKLRFPVRNVLTFWPAGHWYVLLRFTSQVPDFGALEIKRSFPPPNVGPLPLLQQIAYSSLPASKGIFVGGKPLGLTRLNRNEPGALLYSTLPNKNMYINIYLISRNI